MFIRLALVCADTVQVHVRPLCLCGICSVRGLVRMICPSQMYVTNHIHLALDPCDVFTSLEFMCKIPFSSKYSFINAWICTLKSKEVSSHIRLWGLR
jgi:hypothetical protein